MFEHSYNHQVPAYGSVEAGNVYVATFEHHPMRPRLVMAALAVVVSMSFAGALYASPLHYRTYSLSPAQSSPVQAAAAPKPKATAPSPATAAPSTNPPAAPSHPDAQALQAVLNSWQHDYSGSQFGVVVQEVGGARRSASLQADTSFPAASLYKLYLAQYLYNKISSGQLSLTATINSPHNVGDCLQLMIVVSDNACPDAMGAYYGWTNVNRAVQQAGFSETNVATVDTTSPNDVAKYLEELQGGALLNPTSTQSLLSYMKQQIYRSAIPAGVPGIAVADKVGFLNKSWNDAAIVYSPQGTYILVVMSENSNTAAIKDLSQRIHNFMNQ